MNTAKAETAYQRGEVLLRLFEGPTGMASLGRVVEGPDAGRLVLLRKVPERDVVGLELTLGVVRALRHPAVAKVISLVRSEGAIYVASEHIDGVSVHELLRAAAEQGIPIAPRAATRIIHDALLAAEQADALLAWKASPRCIHADTIWVAEYGSTLLSEPGVADYLHRWESHAGAGADVARVGMHSDVRGSAELCRRLIAGADPGAAAPKLPEEIRALTEPTHAWRSRRHLADALAELPNELFGSETDVAEMVSSLVGPTLEMRRLRAVPLDSIRDQCGSDDETTCFKGPLAASSKREPKAATPLTSTGTSVASGERPVAPVYLNESVEPPEPEVDDQEVTTAFRPSRIPRISNADDPPPVTVEAREGTQLEASDETFQPLEPTEATEVSRRFEPTADVENTGVAKWVQSRQRRRRWLTLAILAALAVAAYLLR